MKLQNELEDLKELFETHKSSLSLSQLVDIQQNLINLDILASVGIRRSTGYFTAETFLLNHEKSTAGKPCYERIFSPFGFNEYKEALIKAIEQGIEKLLHYSAKNISMDFKKVYKLPLEKHEGTDKVFHANGHMAFDFLRRYKNGDEDVLHVAEESQKKIINILNGDDSQSIEHPLKHEDGYILIQKDDKWYKIMLIRGWGYLIGTGGLNLSADKAAKIQDDFGNWIVETLSKK